MVALLLNAHNPEISAHVNIIRVIQILAPILCIRIFPGTSNKKYPIKNIPEANANTSSVYQTSSRMPSFAKPILTLSR